MADVTRAVAEAACDQCGAQPGQPCRGQGFKGDEYSCHIARMTALHRQAAVDAFAGLLTALERWGLTVLSARGKS